MATGNSIYWHDYETFGSNPAKDRPCQFAGIRTDEDLNIIDDPLVVFCRPSLDVLPEPGACLVTGITPQQAIQKGLSEAEFSARIIDELARPGTCVAGYNSIRFDDEVTRHLLYRCLYDPYEREWKNGNSRWDIIDLLRLTHALRPEGIEWPVKDDGSPSFKLEDLTRANGIGHEAAHDALSDVHATIALAKLVKRQQPRLFDYFYQLRFKRKVQAMFDLSKPKALLHVSSRYPASKGCMAVVAPLVQHPQNPNGIIVYDLSQNPQTWMQLSADEIQQRLFTPREALEAQNLERIGLKVLHVNKCPALAPINVLNAETIERYELDLAACDKHMTLLTEGPEVLERIRAAFMPASLHEETTDPDLMLYSGGFFSESDKGLMLEARIMDADSLAKFEANFTDPRLPEMLFRYRCRNFPDSLNELEKQRWYMYCLANMHLKEADGRSRLERIRQEITELSLSVMPEKLKVLEQVRAYLDALETELGKA